MRQAAAVIVTATLLAVVAGGVLIRFIDHSEYSNVWIGMWWALQTVTTVGYGDVTPKNTEGRIVGAFVMLEGIAFLAIITAVITSSFVARAARAYEAANATAELSDRDRIDERFDKLEEQLDRIETTLGSQR